MHQHVGQVGPATVAGELVYPDEIQDLGLRTGLLADVADDGVDRAFAIADLSTRQAPEPVSLALLTQQHAAAWVTNDRGDRGCEGAHSEKA